MKAMNRNILFTLITTIVFMASRIISMGCGGGFGVKPAPEGMLK